MVDEDAETGQALAGADEIYSVVVNDEEQYSIWRARRPLPAGWHEAGYTGTKDECLAHIRDVWTDMRPKSLREHMQR